MICFVHRIIYGKETTLVNDNPFYPFPKLVPNSWIIVLTFGSHAKRAEDPSKFP